MKLRHRAAVLLVMWLGLGLPASWLLGADKKPASSPARGMSEEQRAAHALNRLTFGPRPGEVQRVAQMGVDKWIEQQLHPEKIDDSALAARLEGFKTVGMSTREIAENYPPPQVLRAIAEGRMPMPSDPQLRAQYEVALAAYRQRQERRQERGQGDAAAAGAAAMPDQEKEARMYADLKAEELLEMTPEQRMQEILKMTPEERQAFAQSLSPQQRQQMMGDFSPGQREAVMAMVAPQQVVASELMQAKLLRAVYSERQLEEVMTDFWFNHFNVFLNKGADRYLVTSYERDVIRPHALGKFRDLLEATAKSPAMLFYLDNWLSVGPDSDFARYGPGGGVRGNRSFRYRGMLGGPGGYPQGAAGAPRPPAAGPQGRQRQQQQQQQQQNQQRRGLNENYARELMELHTLSVNGGYTQQDVIEVAKCFTGWTIQQPQRGGDFQFDERMHEPGPKTVLGHTIKPGGEREGEEVLDLLARDPHTAQFIAHKLAVRFVSDDPPPALVDRMAQAFLQSDGDIREVLRTLFRSPEFWAPQTYRAKVKTPLEFVVSAVRASGADVTDAQPLVGTLNRMGMPLYGMQTPNGYSWKADAWVNSNALLTRMNFALALGSGRLRGAQVDVSQMLGGPPPTGAGQGLAMLEQALLEGDVSKNTHDTIEKRLLDPQVTQRQLDDPQRAPNLGVIAGLLLGSPEFQRR